MKRIILSISIVSLFFIQCGKDTSSFTITSSSIGNVSQTTKMSQLDSIFKNDSIVKLTPMPGGLDTQGEVEIFEKGGKKLLAITPFSKIDPNSTISNIQVFDTRYATSTGLSLGSTFKDIKDNYTIASIETGINSIIIFLENSPIFITIDKKVLPENVRHDFRAKIEATQIPDTAKFKYFMIGWDPAN